MGIFVKTDMITIPKTCQDCGVGKPYAAFVSCPILNECIDTYPHKRSANCPLVELQVETSPLSFDRTPPEPANTGFPAHGDRILTQAELEQMEGQPVWVVQTEPFAWSGWMLVNPQDRVALCDDYYVYFDALGDWLAYPILPSPVRTLFRSDLLQMHRKPVFVTTIIKEDDDEDPCKNWELVFVEKDVIRLQNHLWWDSVYKESEDQIITTGPQ